MKVEMGSKFPVTLFELEAVSTLPRKKKKLNSAGNICFL